MQLTTDILVASTGCTEARAGAWLAPIQSACNEYLVTTKLRLAAFLAQIGHESGGLHWTAEIWGPTPAQLGYEGRGDLGNTEPGDGSKFRGRGLIQITGRTNYGLAGRALHLDLLDHPELLEQPVNAAMSAAWWWSIRNLNSLADQQQFIAITRRINGGINGLADRQRLYAAAKVALGC